MLDASGHLIKDGHLDRVMNGKPGTAMQAYKTTLSDAEIASVVTFERNSFGNKMGDMVQPAQAKALR
jgi:cytochrome c oxidase subunit 2